MKTLLTTHNSKLGEFIPCFNIPVLSTCPGKTPLCKVYCYARRHHYAMKSIKNKLRYNLCHSKKPEFVDRIITEIKGYHYFVQSKGGVLNRIRLHSSGDFYNQDYLNKWIYIARQFPEINFTGYTRSYMLDFSDLPANLILFYSTDKTTRKFPQQSMRRAYIAHARDINLYRGFPVCSSKCYKCRKCYTQSTQNILFKVH